MNEAQTIIILFAGIAVGAMMVMGLITMFLFYSPRTCVSVIYEPTVQMP